MRDTLYVMESVVHHRKICDRSVLFAGHNSGGFPSADSPFYVSPIHWETTGIETSRKVSDYRNMAVDSDYCKMIGEVMMKNHLLIDPETMEDGLLKSIYKLENISHALIIFVGVKNRKIYYLSFAKYSPSGGFRENEITELLLSANKIKNEVMKK